MQVRRPPSVASLGGSLKKRYDGLNDMDSTMKAMISGVGGLKRGNTLWDRKGYAEVSDLREIISRSDLGFKKSKTLRMTNQWLGDDLVKSRPPSVGIVSRQ